MQFVESDISQLASDIWSSVLGFEIEPCVAQSTLASADCLTGCVQIAGAWRGSVTLEASRTFARTAAATMFSIRANDVTADDVIDTLAELTNMLGGNIKSVLPGPSFLALPSVTEGTDYELNLPSTRPISEVAFTCQGEEMRIKLFECIEAATTV